MQATAFINGKILVDGAFTENQTLCVSDGLIQSIGENPPPDGMATFDLQEKFLAPGFIDVQVNGGGGVLFNDAPTVNTVDTIARAHRRFGTTGLLPTLISDDLEVVYQGLNAVDEAINQEIPGVLGIHIEGPFLNAERRGVHHENKLQSLTAEIVDRIQPLKHGVTVLTLAPDRVDPELIGELVRKGFIVCAGHSDASGNQVQQALKQGVRGFTHLFNAMSQLQAREPGMVGTALADHQSYCGLIADGHHVASTAMELAYRCKGPQHLMLVTDAMPPVGTDQTEFNLQGKPVKVVNGVCTDDNGTLAGTALDMASAVSNMVQSTTCGLESALQMASQTPAAFLGLSASKGSISRGMDADLVILDEHLGVCGTLIKGELNS